MQPIFLIGFMGTGKTTLGKALSRSTGIRFADLDIYIEQQAGKRVKDIFASEGEAGFRKRECEALRTLAQEKNIIVACGGGTPCNPGAMELMNTVGITIWLQPSPQRLIKRLMAGKHKRPLIADVTTEEEMERRISDMTAARRIHYEKAKYVFDSTFLENDTEIAASIDEFKRRFLP